MFAAAGKQCQAGACSAQGTGHTKDAEDPGMPRLDPAQQVSDPPFAPAVCLFVLFVASPPWPGGLG